MKQFSTRNAAIIAFIIAGSFIGYYVWATYRNMQLSVEESRNTKAALEVLHGIEEVFNDMQDVETGVRGYVLTGNKTFLEPYYHGIQKIDGDTLNLIKARKKKPQHDDEIVNLLYLVRAKLNNVNTVVALRDQIGYDTAVSIIKKGKGQELMDSIRGIVQNLENKDRKLLQASNISRETRAKETVVQFSILAIVFFILLFIGFWLISRDVKRQKLLEADRKLRQETLEKLNSQLETQVQLKTKELSGVFDKSNDAFVTIDKDFNFTFVNKKLCDMVKQEPSALIGKNVWEVFPAAEGSVTHQAFKNVLAYQSEHSFTDYYEPLDLWQEFYVYPSEEGLSAFVKDVSKIKRAEASRNREAETRILIMNAALDAIIVVNTKGEITLWNAQSEKIFGWSEAEIKGRKLTNTIIPPAYRDRHQKGMEHYIETGEGNIINRLIEVVALNRNGVEFPIELTILPLEQEGEKYFCSFIRDISLRKKTETELNLSRENYSALVNTVDGIVWEADAISFQFSFVSQQAERLLGYPVTAWTTDPHFWENHIHPDDREFAIDFCSNAIRSKKTHDFEYRMIAADGKVVWLQDFVTVIIENDQPVQLRGIMVDITERKKTDLLIQRSERRYRHLFEQNLSGVYLSNSEGQILTCNVAFAKMMGYDSPAEIMKINAGQFYPSSVSRDAIIAKLKDHKMLYDHELVLKKQDGSLGYFIENVSFTTDPITGEETMEGVMIDITERKKAEEQISREKELSDFIINSLPGIFYLYDETGKFLRWNKNFETVSGYSGEEISSMHPLDFYDSDEKELLKEKITEVFNIGLGEVEAHFFTKDKKKIFYYFNGRLVNYEGKRCLIGMGIDITERKKAAVEITKANERFLLITRATNDLVWDYTLDEQKVWWNDNYYKQLGWEKEDDAAGINTWENYIHPQDKNKVLTELNHILTKTMETTWSSEYRFRNAGGNYINVLDRGYIIRDENGIAYRMIGAMTDLTAVKKAEAELKRSEEKYRLLFEDNPLPLWMFSLNDLRFIDVNESAIIQYGYSKEEFLSMKITDIRPEEDRKKVLNQIRKRVNGVKSTGTWRHLKKDGSVINVEIVSHDTIYQDESVRLVLAIDVTEKLKAEDLLKQSYQDIRELASNLQNIREEERTALSREVHDVLGQQLTGFKMDIYWLNRKLKTKDKEVKEKLDETLKLIDATIGTVRKIATELRPSILDDLGLIAAMEWQSEEFEKRFSIKVHFTSSLGGITVKDSVAIALFRIYQEILTNVARHSHAGKVNSALYNEGGLLFLSVADDGDGFDAEAVTHKKTLGLLGIKERTLLMGGEYQINGSPGKGTIVIVSVPLENSIVNT